MNSKIILLIFCMLVGLFFVYSVHAFDENNEKTDQTKFIITTEAIQVQQDETQLEQQRLSKEAEFNLEKDIKNTYLNQMWAVYSATFGMIIDLVAMFFLVIFIRLVFFITFELIPFGINKLIDAIEEKI